MCGIERSDLALLDPDPEHLGAAAKPASIVLVEVADEVRGAVDDLDGKDSRGQRVVSRETHLRSNVARQRSGRIVFGPQLVQGAIPELDDSAQNRRIELELAVEVVMNVRLRQTGALRDVVHARALEPAVGELLLRRRDDQLLVLAPDPAGLAPPMRRDLEQHVRRFVGSGLISESSLRHLRHTS